MILFMSLRQKMSIENGLLMTIHRLTVCVGFYVSCYQVIRVKMQIL